MNRYRQRHPDFKNGKWSTKSTDRDLTDNTEVADAAKGVWTEAEEHRERVRKSDAAAEARRKAGRRG